MSTYTFLIGYDDEPTEGLDLEFVSRTAAIKEAASFLAEMVERHAGEMDEASVTVGEGSLFADDPEWLGQWQWSEPEGVRWKPDCITPRGGGPSRH